MSEAHDVNVHLTIQRARRVRRKHPLWDVLVILFAAALIGAAANSSVVFGVVGGVAVLLYLISERHSERKQLDS